MYLSYFSILFSLKILNFREIWHWTQLSVNTHSWVRRTFLLKFAHISVYQPPQPLPQTSASYQLPLLSIFLLFLLNIYLTYFKSLSNFMFLLQSINIIFNKERIFAPLSLVPTAFAIVAQQQIENRQNCQLSLTNLNNFNSLHKLLL